MHRFRPKEPRRLGAPDDIAKSIAFHASDDASFMTGAGLQIDGE